MRSSRWIAVLLACSLFLTGCGNLAGGQNQEPASVTIAMGFIPNVQFTPMYVALERGYFADEGLQVELDYGMETDLLQRVGTNDLSFAVGSGDQVILARGGGLPVKYIVNWYRRFPVCVVALVDSGIMTPKDLAGKTVGIPVTEGASYIGWMAFLQQAGIDPAQVNLQVVGYTQMASLTEKRVDAVVCYAMNEPVQLKTAGYDVNVFYLDDYTHLISNGLITNEQTIKKNPKLAQAVTRAFLKGLSDTLADPDAAFAITRKAIPEMDDATAVLQRAVLQECLAFWGGGESGGTPLGVNDPASWEESVSLLRELGLLAVEVKPTDAYDNRFVK